MPTTRSQGSTVATAQVETGAPIFEPKKGIALVSGRNEAVMQIAPGAPKNITPSGGGSEKPAGTARPAAAVSAVKKEDAGVAEVTRSSTQRKYEETLVKEIMANSPCVEDIIENMTGDGDGNIQAELLAILLDVDVNAHGSLPSRSARTVIHELDEEAREMCILGRGKRSKEICALVRSAATQMVEFRKQELECQLMRTSNDFAPLETLVEEASRIAHKKGKESKLLVVITDILVRTIADIKTESEGMMVISKMIQHPPMGEPLDLEKHVHAATFWRDLSRIRGLQIVHWLSESTEALTESMMRHIATAAGAEMNITLLPNPEAWIQSEIMGEQESTSGSTGMSPSRGKSMLKATIIRAAMILQSLADVTPSNAQQRSMLADISPKNAVVKKLLQLVVESDITLRLASWALFTLTNADDAQTEGAMALRKRDIMHAQTDIKEAAGKREEAERMALEKRETSVCNSSSGSGATSLSGGAQKPENQKSHFADFKRLYGKKGGEITIVKIPKAKKSTSREGRLAKEGYALAREISKLFEAKANTWMGGDFGMLFNAHPCSPLMELFRESNETTKTETGEKVLAVMRQIMCLEEDDKLLLLRIIAHRAKFPAARHLLTERLAELHDLQAQDKMTLMQALEQHSDAVVQGATSSQYLITGKIAEVPSEKYQPKMIAVVTAPPGGESSAWAVTRAMSQGIENRSNIKLGAPEERLEQRRVLTIRQEAGNNELENIATMKVQRMSTVSLRILSVIAPARTPSAPTQPPPEVMSGSLAVRQRILEFHDKSTREEMFQQAEEARSPAISSAAAAREPLPDIADLLKANTAETDPQMDVTTAMKEALPYFEKMIKQGIIKTSDERFRKLLEISAEATQHPTMENAAKIRAITAAMKGAEASSTLLAKMMRLADLHPEPQNMHYAQTYAHHGRGGGGRGRGRGRGGGRTGARNGVRNGGRDRARGGGSGGRGGGHGGHFQAPPPSRRRRGGGGGGGLPLAKRAKPNRPSSTADPLFSKK